MHARCLLSAVIALVVATLVMPRAMFAAEATDEELMAGADARIEQCRKADVTVVVVDSAGKPVAGAQIDVEQTRHAFLFGCNIFSWGKLPDERREQAYRQRFAELLNYATLPFYWSMYEPQQGESHARSHAKKLPAGAGRMESSPKGHPLAWNHADPSWLPSDPDEIHRLQMARIDDCVRRFIGLIDRWDVVNEVTHYDREEFAKHKAPKYTAMWKKFGQIAMTARVLPSCPAGQPAGRSRNQRLSNRSGLRAGDRATGR